MTETVDGADLEDVSNVLLLGSRRSERAAEACGELPAFGGADHLLGVTYGRSPAALLDEFAGMTGRRPAEATIICVTPGDPIAGVYAEAGSRPPDAGPAQVDGATVYRVRPWDNVAGVGIAVSEHLGAWRSTADADDTLAFCFDSLTSLLQHVSQKRAFRFLHAISRRVAQTSAVGHYHADREAHDEGTLATFAPLFDATVEIGSGENVEIRW